MTGSGDGKAIFIRAHILRYNDKGVLKTALDLEKPKSANNYRGG